MFLAITFGRHSRLSDFQICHSASIRSALINSCAGLELDTDIYVGFYWGVFICWNGFCNALGPWRWSYLRGSDWDFPGPTFTDGNGLSVSFYNLQEEVYWSDTEYSPDYDLAWKFQFINGFQYMDYKDNTGYTWAVRDGDSSPIPEPTTMLLLGTGLLGLAGARRKMKSQSVP